MEGRIIRHTLWVITLVRVKTLINLQILLQLINSFELPKM